MLGELYSGGRGMISRQTLACRIREGLLVILQNVSAHGFPERTSGSPGSQLPLCPGTIAV
jgi:hypothetical protein